MDKKISAIIFDLGGVLYDIDVKRSVKAFEELGLKNFDKLYSLKEQTALFDKLETGQINQDEFVKNLRKYLPMSSDNNKILDAWRALLIDFPQKNIEILHKLRNNYKIYLLSNTNGIHVEAINKFLKENRGVNNISELFDKIYFSFEIGLRKPGIEIYEHVLKDTRLKPEETVFIDDSEANVKGAEAAGITGIHKPRAMSLREAVAPYMQ